MKINRLLIAIVLALTYTIGGMAQKVSKSEYLDGGTENVNFERWTGHTDPHGHYFTRQEFANEEDEKNGWPREEHFDCYDNYIWPNKPYIEFETSVIEYKNVDDWCEGLLFAAAPGSTSYGNNYRRLLTTAHAERNPKIRDTYYGEFRKEASWEADDGRQKIKVRFYPSDELLEEAYARGGVFRLRVVTCWDYNDNGGKIKQWGTWEWSDKQAIYTIECHVDRRSSSSPSFYLCPNGDLKFSTSSSDYSSGYDHKYVITINGNKYYESVNSSGVTKQYFMNVDPTYKRTVNSQYRMTKTHYFDQNFYNSDNKGRSVYQGYMGDYRTHTVYALPVPEYISATHDQWKRQVNLTWSYEGSSSDLNTSGKWQIWRKKSGTSSYTHIGETSGFSSRSFTDTHAFDLEYDATYDYLIAFCPSHCSWSDYSATSYRNGRTKSIKLTRSIQLSVPTASTDGSTTVEVNWKHAAIPAKDVDGQPSVFQLQRSIDGGASWEDVGNPVSVTSSTVETKGKYSDNQVTNACQTNLYRLKLTAMGTVFEGAPASGRLANMFAINTFEASAGSYAGVVKLQWNVRHQGTDPDQFVVYRRILTNDDNEKDEWMQIYKTSGVNTSYFYEDNTALPGTFYKYKVEGSIKCGDTYDISDQKEQIGFAQSIGVISGRVAYGTGTAVEGVRVNLTQDGDITGNTRDRQFSSMALSGAGAKLQWNAGKDKFTKIFAANKPFTIQMWVKVDSTTTDGTLFEMGDLRLKVKKDMTTAGLKGTHRLAFYNKSTKNDQYFGPENSVITPNQWIHLTYVHKGKGYTPSYFVRTCVDSLDYKEVGVVNANGIQADADLGTAYTLNFGSFVGNIDDVRVWDAALTEKQDSATFGRILSGLEKNLKLYWPMDEAINYVFDVAKTGGIANANHATNVNCTSSSDIPSPAQLGLFGMTDGVGNYIIRGIPFNGEGVNYTITPTMGVHSFSPHHSTRFISASQLNHSGVDFEDRSSFKVTGKVRYAHTDYPVEGVNLYVDGNVAARDGKIITTDANGEYEISVPIGDHYITVGKPNHTFVDGGRYPYDPDGVGKRFTFQEEVSNLDFEDATLVTVAGRVAGGDVEGNKPMGMGLSKNNIGTVEIVLESVKEARLNVIKKVNGTVIDWQTDKNPYAVPATTEYVKSSAFRGAGDSARCIYIYTDPMTGEYSAKVPPIEYKMLSTKIVKTDSIIRQNVALDATNCSVLNSDSVVIDGVQRKSTWHTAYSHTHHVEPTFDVTQLGAEKNAFGEQVFALKEFDIETQKDKETPIQLYTVAKDGKVTYHYNDAAIFVAKQRYTFEIKGYELFTNADKEPSDLHYADKVPLAGTVVTISNALSDKQSVYIESKSGAVAGSVVELKENECVLDSAGTFKYVWQAGLPNITAPYTRTLAISYKLGGQVYQWRKDPLQGVILGDLTTGNNFVTAGPDRLTYVLRDPAGSGSSATWTSGSTVEYTETHGTTFVNENDITTVSSFGPSTSVTTGTAGMGAMAATTVETEATDDVTVGTVISSEANLANSSTFTVSTSRDISTSDGEDYVGDQGDIFFGTGTNLIFGKANQVCLQRTKDNENLFELGVKSVTSFGSSFSTVFAYTQKYVKEVLLPNLENMRLEMLQTKDQAYIKAFKNTTDKTVYLTTLEPTDEKYGTPGTYTMFVPENGKGADIQGSMEGECYKDQVDWIYLQIKNWQGYMYDNERNKVLAFNQRDKYLENNYSFDAGSSITNTVSNDDTESSTGSWSMGATMVAGVSTGFEVNKVGVTVDMTTNIGLSTNEENGESTTLSNTITYTLADDGVNDALTVDVYNAPDGFGPIFRTRGGQTSAPYEGKVVTEYYHPGTIISEATMQIEVPTLGVTQPVLGDIPSGRPADFTLQLGNASETADECTYNLYVIDETNTNGARITVDGQEISTGRLVKVAYGETLNKSLQLWQTKMSVRDFENIGVVLSSTTDDELSDTVYISAHFIPSSSDVTLQIPVRTMNVRSGDVLNAVIRDFDRTYENFKSLTLQYRYEEDDSWVEMKKYVMEDDKKNTLIPTSGNIPVSIDMDSYPDGKYTFRVVSAASYGIAEEVTVNSEEIVVIKDMHRPQLLGSANPTDGILSAGDAISVRFNEDIRKGALTKDRNFIISGVRNDAKIAHDVAVKFAGAPTPAATQLPINLSGKDFTIDMWMNITGDGTILAHGTRQNGLTIDVDAAGHIIVKMGQKTLTSNSVIAKDRWIFFTLNYKRTDEGGMLSALYAKDASETILFSEEVMPAYKGNGRLALGKNLEGAIQEVALWNVARDNYLSLSERELGKSPVTPGLIGYWKMNEGHGLVAADAAEARHITLAGDNWYMNNINCALALDGKKYLSINSGAISPRATESYAVEFWYRADRGTKAATLLQAGNGELSIGMNAAGTVVLNAAGEVYESSAKPRNEVWHHCLLNVQRGGSAILYVDGVNVLTLPEGYVPALAGSELLLGVKRTPTDVVLSYTYDDFFKGSVDEVRVWNGQYTGKYLNDKRYERIDTVFAAGLVGYYPMEQKAIGHNNQIETTFNLEDASVNRGVSGTAKVYAVASNKATETQATQAATAPAMKSAPAAINLQYNFTASEREIFINLNEQPDRMEGTIVDITLRDVQDVNGNQSSAVTWSAYVRQNGLVWASDDVVLDALSGAGSSFKATIANRSGVVENWTLSNLPSWLSADVEYGMLAPASEQEITFTVAPSVAVGNHDEVLYLTGNNNIVENLNFRLNVRAEAPAWSVDPTQFEYSSTLTAQVFVNGLICENPETRVAAFINGQCTGLSNIEYVPTRDAYYLFMTIYGNEAEAKKPITFKVWDASTGIIYTDLVVNDNAKAGLTFGDNSEYGTVDQPTKLAATPRMEQVVNLTQGWNWVSFYVDATDALQALKASGKLLTITDGKAYSDAEGGALASVKGDRLYKVKMAAPASIAVTGNEAGNRQTVSKGFNWIGGAHLMNLPLQDAFTSVAHANDMVKGMRSFAIFNGNVWEGSLKVVEPGKGYIYKNASAQNGTLVYPKAVSDGAAHARRMDTEEVRIIEHFAGLTDAADSYKANMTMVACVTRGDELIANAEVAVYAGAEFRTAAVTDEKGRLFLTIPGETDGEQLRFVVFAEGQEYTISSATSLYTNDAHYGTLNAPTRIDVSSTTGINLGVQNNGEGYTYYDLDGRTYGTFEEAVKNTGVIIRRGADNKAEKVLVK